MPASLDALARRLGSPALWGRLALLTLSIVGTGWLLAAAVEPLVRSADEAVDSVTGDLLDFPPLAETFAADPERSVVLDRHGEVLAYLREENRRSVPLADVPAHVRDAVLATEDARFFDHPGVNWRAVARAAAGNLRAGRVTSGASTITQQLVKLLTGEDADTFDRKLREAVWAAELEERFTKAEILERYLNRAYFGQGVYGIATAAEYYFGRSISEVTLAEGAVLAGIVRAPEVNNPEDDPGAARERRAIVLEQMVREGVLDPAAAAAARAEPLTTRISPLQPDRLPFFVDHVRSVLEAEPALGPDRVTRERAYRTGGLVIRTTIDSRLTGAADAAIRAVLPPGGPNAALTAVDPRTGEILAVGFGPTPYGDGDGQTMVNPALPGLGSTGRPSGSSFKAFEVVAALEAGISPTYTIDTPSPYESVSCRNGDGSPYRPGNYADSGGGVMDMAGATARSSNVYFVHLVDRLAGPEALVETAERMGVPRARGLQPLCSAVLGTADVLPLDMASALGTLANRGEHCAPFAVAEVLDRYGRVLMRGGERCRRAVDGTVAARATALLRGPLEHGTASRNGQIGRPAAGKTGTAQRSADAWFVGYVPQLSAATWVGWSDAQRPMSDRRCGGAVTGGCLPTMIWQRFMRAALDGVAVEDFAASPPLPRGVVPDEEGETVTQAEAEVREDGFVPILRTVSDFRSAGVVVRQSPSGGAETELGSGVVLEISDGRGRQPVVPGVIGEHLEGAVAALRAVGLRAVIVEVPRDDADVGIVIGQDPRAGASTDSEPVELRVGRRRHEGDAPAAPSAGPSSGGFADPSLGPTAVAGAPA